MTLVVLIASILAFIACLRFCNVLNRAVDWLYLPDPEEEDSEDDE